MAAPSWDQLLAKLATHPRENGDPAIHETATYLAEMVRSMGVDPILEPFSAYTYVLRVTGLLIFASGLAYFLAARAKRYGLALAVAVIVPATIVAQVDYYLPIYGPIGAVTEHHVRAVIGPAEPKQRLMFMAHYDTKTDVLDHVERSPINLLAPLFIAFMALAAAAAVWGRRREGAWAGRTAKVARVASWVALVHGALSIVSLSAGAVVPDRSAGALDDGAACAVMARVMAKLQEAPLAQTEVEMIWLAAEEIGVQGSYVHAARRFADGMDVPTFVVNLEGLGASTDFAIFGTEAFNTRSYKPDPRIVKLLRDVHHERTKRTIDLTWYPAGTDARSLLDFGVPAATLISTEPGEVFMRHLHSQDDHHTRLNLGALDETVDYLVAVTRAADSRGL